MPSSVPGSSPGGPTKWCGGDEYVEPLRPEPGEVPADLLARLRKRPHSDPTLADDGFIAKREAEGRAT